MTAPAAFGTPADYFGAARLEAAERAVRSLTFRDALLAGSAIVGRSARHISPYPDADAAREIAFLSARIRVLAPEARDLDSLLATIGSDVQKMLRYGAIVRELLAVARATWPDLGTALDAAAQMSGSEWTSNTAQHDVETPN
ncbi:hypothetical protein GWK16_16370 [Roseomonas sp. JC162]|uniref:Uncharacterized protein n=1 Tax=Neoroseomonas marina TaxID=1232220 RepID=A0A848EFJ4_9PROT|nr:hypothetical protein [Neoroseomonas marina]NMJ42822.1 hypothetical protein [Neoroseomonas marina]